MNIILIALFISPFLIACGKFSSTENTTPGMDTATGIDNSLDHSIDMSAKIAICSDLSLTNVKWPNTLNDFTVNALALAMNLTGSYEGHTGWDNIATSFDGQGLSLGLFNQNLGQGSLQPLLIGFRNLNSAAFRSFFSSAQYTSLNNMLTTWGSTGTVLTKALPLENFDRNYSDLDDPQFISDDDFSGDWSVATKASNSTNQKSVDWATANLYSGSNFKAEWKNALQAMSRSPNYISLQIKAASAIHSKAEGYLTTYGFSSLRAYLFFFDVVVQNGGITSTASSQYLTWLKTNKSATETIRLKKLLEYRLQSVLAEYVSDVRARKTAIIDGIGTVHGRSRNFASEYCVGSWAAPYSLSSLGLL